MPARKLQILCMSHLLMTFRVCSLFLALWNWYYLLLIFIARYSLRLQHSN